MQGTASTQRPMGVTILAVLAIIGGIFGILGAIALLGLGGLAATVDAGIGTIAILLGIGYLIQAALSLAFGIGAWTLKPWAWTLGIVSQVLSLLLIVINIATGSDITGQIVGIVIAGIILFYLFTPNVRQAFGKA